MKRYKIIKVKWCDSNFRSGWAGEHEVGDIEPLAIGEAVGFLKGENKEVITLTMSLGNNNCTLGALTIAKSAIIEMKELRLK